MIRLSLLFPVALALGACAQHGTNVEPILDGGPSATYQSDLQDCRTLAQNQRQLDQETVAATVIAAVVAFIAENPGLLIAWNTIIYVVNALALAVLVVALHDRLASFGAEMAGICRIFGTIWATLVLGAGMIANVGVERAHALSADPQSAAALWEVLHAIELGLGGGNEIAGGAWILAVSLAALSAHALPRFAIGLGTLTGGAGMVTIIPAFGDVAGAIFGLSAMAWFVTMGITLLQRAGPTPKQPMPLGERTET